MAIFGRGGKPSYQPIWEPVFTRVPIADARVMRRDRKMIASLVQSVQEEVARIGPDASPRVPVLAVLEQRMLEALTANRPSATSALLRPLYWAIHIGYVVGLMENRSEIAKPGQAEDHYWAALILLWTQMPTDGFGDEVRFAAFAAYYVARRGEVALDPMIDTAAAWAGQKGEQRKDS